MRPKNGGRKTGALNKYSYNVKAKLSESIDEEFVNSIFVDILAIDNPAERVRAKIKLLEFFVPKAKDPVEANKEDDFRERFIEALQLKT